MNEARKKYLWSLRALPHAPAWRNANVRAVVLKWTARGYVTVREVPFLARDAAHAQEVGLAVYNLWCIAHEEEVV